MTDYDVKFFIGPMSKNVVDAVIEVNKDIDLKIGFIPSRRQVEYDGGYVNNWTTKSFSNYVKSKSNSIFIERDHGGPGQGYHDDDGIKSYEWDSKYFDIIHIDPWKKYQNYEDGLAETIKGINLCYSINPDCFYEIGTEESIRYFNPEELERMIVDLKKFLLGESFSKIKYAVVQSGVGLNLGKQENTGIFNPKRLQSMVDICQEHNILSKEHNGDYLSLEDMKARFDIGLDAINIAPEFGQFETDVYLKIMKELKNYFKEEFFNICYKSKRWEKWVKDDFYPKQEKDKIIKISGHYVFSDLKFIKLKNELADNLGISVSQLNEKVKEKIKSHLLSFKQIVNKKGKGYE